jgi:hypothetical protein
MSETVLGTCGHEWLLVRTGLWCRAGEAALAAIGSLFARAHGGKSRILRGTSALRWIKMGGYGAYTIKIEHRKRTEGAAMLGQGASVARCRAAIAEGGRL